MKTSVLKSKYVIPIFGILMTLLFIHIFFWKSSDQVFITNIYGRSFDDTVTNVYSKKYNGGVVVATRLKTYDTALIIDGVNDSLHLYFSSYADLGLKNWEAPNFSLLKKNAKTDSFYLEKGGELIGFKLTK